MTGGFFAVNNHGKLIPQGLVRSGRQERSPKYPWTSGGIVGVRNGLTQIIPISQAGETKKFSEALQSKPILIWNGEDGIFSAQNERFDRSAVGIDKHGNIFFFVLSEPTGMAASLAEFSYLLMQYRSTMGTAISAALAMDGGPGAHLYVPELKRHCGAGTPNYVPNALYIR
jgi:uncharacterized protein YigE (DUF2233 family)